MKKAFFMLVLALFSLNFCTIACADVFLHEKKLDYIVSKLPELKSADCKFKQVKTVQGSSVRLQSSGNFKFDLTNGAIFYTTYPIKAVSSFSDKQYRQINSIIKAINSKNFSRLEHEFKFYFEEGANGFTLGLKPNFASKTANYLEFIEISGKNGGVPQKTKNPPPVISRIIVLTKDKTKTVIDFSAF